MVLVQFSFFMREIAELFSRTAVHLMAMSTVYTQLQYQGSTGMHSFLSTAKSVPELWQLLTAWI